MIIRWQELGIANPGASRSRLSVDEQAAHDRLKQQTTISISHFSQ
jgi:hypothetical protein